MMRYIDWLVVLAVLVVAMIIFYIVIHQAAPIG
jgi:hypothetical protein